MSREIARRLAMLEQRQGADRRYYAVSDRPLSEERWNATKDGGDFCFGEPDDLSPIMTLAEWQAVYCRD